MAQTLRLDFDLSSGAAVVDIAAASALSLSVEDIVFHSAILPGSFLSCFWSADNKVFHKFHPLRFYTDRIQNKYELRASGNIRFLKIMSSTYLGDLTLYVRCEEQLDSRPDPREYDGLQARTTQSFTEANFKAGVEYEVGHEYRDVPELGFRYISFETGDTDVIIKSRLIQSNNVDTLLEVFENSEFTQGETVKCFNLNRNVGENGQVVVTHTPVVLAEGVIMTPAVPVYGSPGVGNRSSGGFTVLGAERVLKRNSKYLIKMTARLGLANLWFYATWYEGPISPDI